MPYYRIKKVPAYCTADPSLDIKGQTGTKQAIAAGAAPSLLFNLGQGN